MTSLSEARSDLKGIAKTLARLERQGIGLSDYAQGLRRISNVLGVVMDELSRLEKEQAAIGRDFGDHLLAHERGETQ